MVMFSTHDTKPQYKQSKNQTGYTMKDWKTIKDNYAREQGYDDWNEILYSTDDPNELDIHIDAVSLLRAKESLDNAGENSKVLTKNTETGNELEVISWTDARNVKFSVSKQSITNENNIPL